MEQALFYSWRSSSSLGLCFASYMGMQSFSRVSMSELSLSCLKKLFLIPSRAPRVVVIWIVSLVILAVADSCDGPSLNGFYFNLTQLSCRDLRNSTGFHHSCILSYFRVKYIQKWTFLTTNRFNSFSSWRLKPFPLWPKVALNFKPFWGFSFLEEKRLVYLKPSWAL